MNESITPRYRDEIARLRRLLVGPTAGPPQQLLVRCLFLRGLGLVALLAFGSLARQLDGLYGEQGLPAARSRLCARASAWASPPPRC